MIGPPLAEHPSPAQSSAAADVQRFVIIADLHLIRLSSFPTNCNIEAIYLLPCTFPRGSSGWPFRRPGSIWVRTAPVPAADPPTARPARRGPWTSAGSTRGRRRPKTQERRGPRIEQRYSHGNVNIKTKWQLWRLTYFCSWPDLSVSLSWLGCLHLTWEEDMVAVDAHLLLLLVQWVKSAVKPASRLLAGQTLPSWWREVARVTGLTRHAMTQVCFWNDGHSDGEIIKESRPIKAICFDQTIGKSPGQISLIRRH